MRLMRLLATACCAVLSAPLLAFTAHAAPENELRLVAVRDSLLATHYWYEQTYAGLPVLEGYYARHVDKDDGREDVADGRRAVSGLAGVTPTLTALAAQQRAEGQQPFDTTLAILPGDPARLVYSVIASTYDGSVRTVVDATSGEVLRSESLVMFDADPDTSSVFDPNPPTALQDRELADKDDADAAVPRKAYKTVKLTDLDGSGYLKGDYAKLVGPEGAPKDKLARSEHGRFKYTREDGRFEQVMVYYGVTQAQRFIQSLDFRDVNNEAQKFTTFGYTKDNSYFDPRDDQLTFGTGGVDDAEDIEVVWHELGHAMQAHQIPGLRNKGDAGALGEGFGDWWAMIMSAPGHPDNAKTPLACIMEWDHAPYCLRRTDTNFKMRDRTGEVHDDGRIWSRALYDIYRELGRKKSATIVLEAQFSYKPDTSFAEAAQVTVNTARKLEGDNAADMVHRAFAARGIL